MKARFVMVMFCVSVLAVSGAFAADISTAVRLVPAGPLGPLDAPVDLRGETQPTPAGESCCQFTDDCPPQPQTYTSGELFALNTYVTQTLPDDGTGMIPTPWTLDWTLGVLPPGGALIPLFLDEPVDFGDLNAQGFFPGDTLNFCIVGTLSFETAPDIAGIGFGSRWVTLDGSTQGLLGDFNLTP